MNIIGTVKKTYSVLVFLRSKLRTVKGMFCVSLRIISKTNMVFVNVSATYDKTVPTAIAF
jgi:hypothetical protein